MKQCPHCLNGLADLDPISSGLTSQAEMATDSREPLGEDCFQEGAVVQVKHNQNCILLAEAKFKKEVIENRM